MSDNQWWTDPRWGDPQTRAAYEQPHDVWGAPPTFVPAPVRRRPISPVLTGLLGLAIGAAAAIPVGLAQRNDTGVAETSPFVPAPQTTSAAASAIADKVDPSIVDITSRLGFQGATAAGTGMVLDNNGDILTNNHVIVDATSITVTSVTTGARFTATVLGTDPTQDVAVLHIKGHLAPIAIGNSSAFRVGDAVVAIGNAGGVGGTPAVASGFVTALDQTITARDGNGGNPQRLTGLIETDAPIRPGDSGGPLVSSKAQVIGMDTAASLGGGLTAGSNRGFAIPIRRALAIAQQIERGQGSATVHIGPRGMIGVEVAVSTSDGAVVSTVESGSPAAQAGIEPGDTIVAIDGERVTTADSLGKLIKAHAAGEHVTVTWTSPTGGQHSAQVTLAAGPPD